MRTLVLSVDRDNDYGRKSAIASPIIGREDAINAAVALGIKDAEDSDVNTLLAAIGMYDEMVRKGMDVEVALICGDEKVGYESDLILSSQLESVLEIVRPDRIVLVSDGAEDEFIYPMISSRSTIDSVKRVYVKQAPGVEGTYYILVKMMKDSSVRVRLLTPIAIVLLVFGLFSIIPKIWDFAATKDVGGISQMAGGTITLLLGVYMIYFVYNLKDRYRQFRTRVNQALKSGSQIIPFAILSIILVFTGLFLGADAASTSTDTFTQVMSFVSVMMWSVTFALLSYETGRFVNTFVSKGLVYAPYLVVSIEVLAIVFLAQASIDALLGYLRPLDIDEAMIVMEIFAGFLLAVFGGLLNSSFNAIVSDVEDEAAVSDA